MGITIGFGLEVISMVLVGISLASYIIIVFAFWYNIITVRLRKK